MSRLIVRYSQADVVGWGEFVGAPPTRAEDAIELRPLAVVSTPAPGATA